MTHCPNPDDGSFSDLIDAFLDQTLNDGGQATVWQRMGEDFGAREQMMQTLAADGLISWALAGPGDSLTSECDGRQMAIRRYHRGSLAGEAVTRLSRHLELCTGCQGYYRSLKRADAASATGRRGRPRQRAALVMIMVGLLGGAALLLGDRSRAVPGQPALAASVEEVLEPHADGWPKRRASATQRQKLHGIGQSRWTAEAYRAHLDETEGEGFIEELVCSPRAQDLRAGCLSGLDDALQNDLLILMFAVLDPHESWSVRAAAAAGLRRLLVPKRVVHGAQSEHAARVGLSQRQRRRVLSIVYSWFEDDCEADPLLAKIAARYLNCEASGWGRRFARSVAVGQPLTSAMIFGARSKKLDAAVLGVALDLLQGTRMVRDPVLVSQLFAICQSRLEVQNTRQRVAGTRLRELLGQLAKERGDLAFARLFAHLSPDEDQRRQVLALASHADRSVRLAVARFVVESKDAATTEVRQRMIRESRARLREDACGLHHEILSILENNE